MKSVIQEGMRFKAEFPKEFKSLLKAQDSNAPFMEVKKKLLSHIPSFKSRLIGDQHTRFLTVWSFLHGSWPVCKVCGAQVQKYNTKTFAPRPTCSLKCAHENTESYKKGAATCLKKYGVPNPSKDPSIKEKIRQTFLAKYGKEHALQVPEFKRKYEQTSMSRYGASHIMQTAEGKRRVEESCLLSKGVLCYMGTEEFVEKSRQTNLAKRGVEWAMQDPKVRAKSKTTSLVKYGVSHPTKHPRTIRRRVATNQIKYGEDSHMQNAEVQQRFKISSFRTKKVKLLGKTHSVQGAEDIALLAVESTLQYVITSCASMPNIKYKDRAKVRRYYPDALVKKLNGQKVMIEVKSPYYLKMGWSANKKKFKAACSYCFSNSAHFAVAIVEQQKVNWIIAKNEADLGDFFNKLAQVAI